MKKERKGLEHVKQRQENVNIKRWEKEWMKER